MLIALLILSVVNLCVSLVALWLADDTQVQIAQVETRLQRLLK